MRTQSPAEMPPIAENVKVSVILPLYNEADSIKFTLDAIEEATSYYANKEIIVVDGGSVDGTPEIVSQVGETHSAVRLVSNSSISSQVSREETLRMGARAATGNILVFIDADLVYDPYEIPTLVDPLIRNEADVVLGSRFLGPSYRYSISNLYRLMMFFVSLLVRFLFRVSLTEPTTRFAAFRSHLVACDGPRSDSSFLIENLAEALKQKVVVKEVPVASRVRRGSSSLMPAWAMFRLLRHIAVPLIRAKRGDKK